MVKDMAVLKWEELDVIVPIKDQVNYHAVRLLSQEVSTCNLAKCQVIELIEFGT